MIPGSANPLLLKSAAAAGGGYQIERSLRFNSSDSAYLSRTPAVAGSRTTWTWAGWVKLTKPGSKIRLLSAGTSTTNLTEIYYNSDLLEIFHYPGSISCSLITTQVFRDFSAWHHIVVACDTTIASPSSDRIKLYVNGAQITSFSTATYPAQNTNTFVNAANVHYIGATLGLNPAFMADGYLADIHFISGQALDATAFTEVSATTGQLIPKAYSGSYTGNSFHLDFADNSALTSGSNVGIGKDTSGLGNYWNTSGLSVTAGAGNDSLVDTPTSYGTDTSVGGEVRGNYCTLNPLFSGTTLTNGNLDAEGPSNNWFIGRGTIAFPDSAKWYFEATVTGTAAASYSISVATAAAANSTGNVNTATGIYGIVNNTGTTTTKFVNGTASTISTAAAWAQGDILMCAYDGATSKVWFGRNGTWYPPTNGGSAGNPGAGTNETMTASGTVFPAVHCYGTSADMSVNFGQRAFAYPLSGFKALCDTNLGAPLVAKPNTVMDVVKYDGNGSTQTITGLGFSPDWVWVKSRSAATGHKLIDSVRGATFALAPGGSLTTDTNGLTAFTSDGFSLGTDTNYNNTSATYVGWCWDTGGTTTTETSPGTVSVDRRVNVSAGFSIAKFTSAASGNFSIAHGLGVAPSFVMISAATTYHASVCTTVNNYFNFGTTQGLLTYSTIWGAALPTSSVVSMTVGGAVGANAANVAYCFAPVVGYSSFGSYTGNGSADGPFVYTGFRPRWVMYKVYSGDTGHWWIHDTSRDPYNEARNALYANLSASENTNAHRLDILSNGYKIRSSDININGSGFGFIYAAFAENPFQYARAR